MANRYLLVDDVTGKYKRGSDALPTEDFPASGFGALTTAENTKTLALDRLDRYLGRRVNHDFVIQDQFCGGTLAGRLGWGAANSGGSSNVAAPIDAKYVGAVRAATGTGATGRSAFLLNQSAFCFGNDREHFISFRGAILTNLLPNGTDNYFVVIGAHDLNTAVDCTDGIYFKYDHTVSANWRFVIINDGVKDEYDTGVAVAFNTFYDLDFLVNSTGTQVTAWINDTLINTYTSSNIPKTIARVTGLKVGINKTLGTNERSIHIHGLYWRVREVV
jgi:hypothetical protein